VPKPAKFEKKELDLAKKLIDTLAGPFEPEQYHDEYKQNVEKLIESKRKGRKITPISQPKKAPVIDLMQALQQSLARTASARPKSANVSKGKRPARKRSAKVA
jgi:DNA end-binding protein Ku